MKVLHIAAFTLMAVGALNWGLVGLFDFNLVTALLGMIGIEKLVYIIIGASAVYIFIGHKKDCKVCAGK